MVEAAPVEGVRNDYGSRSRNNYGSGDYGSRNDYDSRDYGSRDYGSRDCGSHNDNGSNRVTINDLESAQCKLKKIWEENWTALDSKTAGDTK